MKTIATVVAVSLSLCASVAQMQLIWDREYTWPTSVRFVADAVMMADGRRLALTGEPYVDEGIVYVRTVSQDGEVLTTLPAFTSSTIFDVVGLYLTEEDRAILHCSSCRRPNGELVHLISVDFDSVVATTARRGLSNKGQLQSDGSIAVVGSGPVGVTNQRVVYRWRWGQIDPDWSTTITAPVAGIARFGEFPSNQRRNPFEDISPVSFTEESTARVHLLWYSVSSSGQIHWVAAQPAGMYLDNVIDDEGNRYIAYHRSAPDGGYSFWWTLLKSSPTGQILWDRDIGLAYLLGYGRVSAPVMGRPWQMIYPSLRAFHIYILDPADGSTIRLLPYNSPDQRSIAGRFLRDLFGGTYLRWGLFDGPPGIESFMHKLDENGDLIWAQTLTGMLPDSVHQYVFDGDSCVYLIGPSRIQKWRIRAAFVEGDASGDGCIDDKDLAMTLEAFGTNDPTADFDSNGIVDDRDLERALRNFGLGCVE